LKLGASVAWMSEYAQPIRHSDAYRPPPIIRDLFEERSAKIDLVVAQGLPTLARLNDLFELLVFAQISNLLTGFESCMQPAISSRRLSAIILNMIKLTRDEQCPHCGRFSNRGLSIDAVIIKDDNILLIQRGVEPNKGFWGTPGGYVEWDESTEETVKREVKEETGLSVVGTKLVGVYSSPKRHPKQVVNILYIAEVEDGEPKASDDAQDIRWFSIHELPQQMALDHKQNITDALKLLGRNE
jgi:8-oxo-dGTP diphosphatase